MPRSSIKPIGPFIDDARSRIDDFIANICNTERLHSALGYRSPLEFEAAFAQNNNGRAGT